MSVKLNGVVYSNISHIQLPGDDENEYIDFYCPEKETLVITGNGNYNLDKYYNNIAVNVNFPLLSKEPLVITENGNYNLDKYYNNIKVNFPLPSGTLNINQTGTYDVTNYKLVNINIPTEEQKVKIDINENTTILLEHNTEFRRNIIDNLILKLPGNIPNEFECQISFTSSENGTNIIFPRIIKLKGDDILNGELIIKPNYRYNLLFWNDGVYIWCTVYAEPYIDPAKILGSGTFEDPYLISSALQLKTLADEVNNGDNKKGKYYLLTNDIDLIGYNWIPIGNDQNVNTRYGFSGIFNGNGYVIRNLYINSNTLTQAGLFGKYFNGTLMNLGIEDGSITTTAANSEAGAFIGFAEDPDQTETSKAVIINSYARIPCQATKASAGLIGGAYSGCTMLLCYQSAPIKNGYGFTASNYFNIKYCNWNTDFTNDAVDYSQWRDPSDFIDYYWKDDADLYDIIIAINNGVNQGCNTLQYEIMASHFNQYLDTIIQNKILPSTINPESLCRWEDGPDGYPILIPKEIKEPTVPTAYTLTISKGTGVESVTVTKTSGYGTTGTLNSGATIYKGDVLSINAVASSGYTLNSYTSSITVSGNITVNITATADTPTGMTGSGTEADPYMISTAAHLTTLGEEVDAGDNKAGKYYALANDIDLTGIDWNPIGADLSESNGGNKYGFSGIFDGCGYIIKNLTINSDSIQYAGLFGSYFDGILMNLGLEGGSINTTRSSSTTGALARKMVSATDSTTSNARIINCYSRVPCTAVARSAGLVDSIQDGGILANCYQAASVNNDSGDAYAIKSEDKAIGTIFSCLWNKNLTTNGIANAKEIDETSNGLTTEEFTTSSSVINTLNSNLQVAAILTGIDVSRLCSWETGNDGYPRLKVKTI